MKWSLQKHFQQNATNYVAHKAHHPVLNQQHTAERSLIEKKTFKFTT